VIPVHFAGLASDMEAILQIAKCHALRVVEDGAHALPATSGRHLVGTLESDATVFSFYATKTLATGEGGMIVTRNEQLAKRCRVMRLHGIDRDAFDRYTSTCACVVLPRCRAWFQVQHDRHGCCHRHPSATKADRFLLRREALARRYDEGLRDLCLRLPAHAPDGEVHAWHLYVVRLNDEAPISREDFINEMTRAGIGTSVHFIPLHLHPYWRDTYNLRPEDFPNATPRTSVS